MRHCSETTFQLQRQVSLCKIISRMSYLKDEYGYAVFVSFAEKLSLIWVVHSGTLVRKQSREHDSPPAPIFSEMKMCKY